MERKASRISLLKYAFNLIIYYLLFSALKSSQSAGASAGKSKPSVYYVCVTGVASGAFVILMETPQLSVEPLCYTPVNSSVSNRPNNGPLTHSRNRKKKKKNHTLYPAQNMLE